MPSITLKDKFQRDVFFFEENGKDVYIIGNPTQFEVSFDKGTPIDRVLNSINAMGPPQTEESQAIEE
jgi:hypothetical protein